MTNSPDSSSAAEPADRLSLADQAYDAIVDLILTYQLHLGARTSVAQLAERLGLGRTPVKEAISRLEAEGLLTVSGRSGTTVKEIDADSARQLFALRRHLESFAVNEAVRNVTAEKLRELRTLLEQLRWTSESDSGPRMAAANYVRSNVRFHAAVVSCAANPILDRIYAQIQLQTQIVVFLYHMTSSVKEKIIKRKYAEHVAIYKALEARNADKLRELLDEHAARTEMSVLESLSELRNHSTSSQM
jgi:GntR family transcriptional regulator, rspAB operon transcriptional repressor